MALSTAHDIDAWRQLSSRHFVELECWSTATAFTASIDSRRLTASTSVSRVRSGPIQVDRTPRLARTDARDDVLLNLQLGRSGAVSQFGRTARLSPGDAALYDTRYTYRLSMPSPEQDLIVVRLPRRSLGLDDRAIRQACARPLLLSSSGVAALGGLLAGVVAEPGDIHGVQGDLALVVEQLVAVTVRGPLRPDTEPWARADDGALLAALRAQIVEQAHDPDFDVPALAGACFVSVRKVHTLFAATGETPGTVLRTTRLRAAAAMLRDREASRTPIRAVAARCGFADSGTFGRAFRAHFGVTPGAWRSGDGTP